VKRREEKNNEGRNEYWVVLVIQNPQKGKKGKTKKIKNKFFWEFTVHFCPEVSGFSLAQSAPDRSK
jgi:hypothetical protein